MRYFLYILLTLFAVSCKPTDFRLETVKLTKVSEIDEFSDSSYFSDIRFMYADNNLLYVSDYTRNQIMVLDILNNEYLTSTVSSNGEGPGELLGALAIIVNNDTLFVYDDGKRAVSLFAGKKYIRNIKTPFVTEYRFGLKNRCLVMSGFQHPHSLCFLNIDTDSIVWFGKMFNFHSPVTNRIRNCRDIYISDNNIFAVSDNQPVVERYDMDGNFIDEYNYLDDVREVKDQLSYILDQSAENSYCIIIGDGYLYNNKLYLILTTRKNNTVKKNTILEIDVTKNMKVTRLFDLGKGWFESICVYDKYIWAFEKQECKLIKFELS
jgi:hypothetical protein